MSVAVRMNIELVMINDTRS